MLSVEQIFSKEAQEWQQLFEQAQAAWQAGDYDRAGDVFMELQDRSMAWLQAIARRKAPEDVADELVAETYLALLNKLEAGEPVQKVKGLLGTILRYRIVDEYRRRNGIAVEQADETFWARYAESSVEEDSNEAQIVVEQLTATSLVNTLLQELPPVERDVLIARHLDMLSVADTAVRLHMTEDQVKKRTRKAIQLAHQIIEAKGLINDVN